MLGRVQCEMRAFSFKYSQVCVLIVDTLCILGLLPADVDASINMVCIVYMVEALQPHTRHLITTAPNSWGLYEYSSSSMTRVTVVQ